jgi:hypothetical protein
MVKLGLREEEFYESGHASLLLFDCLSPTIVNKQWEAET